MSRYLIRVYRGRGDKRSPYVVAEEIAVQHPVIFKRVGRQSTVGGIPIRRMESTGSRNRKLLDIVVRRGTTATGIAATSRERAQAQATAAGIKKVCRRLRPQEGERIDAIDAEIAEIEGQLAEARARRAEAIRMAWAKANVVRLAELEEEARRFEAEIAERAKEQS